MSSRIDLELDLLLRSQDLIHIQSQFNNTTTPINNKFLTNLEMLKNGAKRVLFNVDKWIYNPELFCIDYYKDGNLALPLMITNGIKSRFEFTPKSFANTEIHAPFIDDVYKLLTFR